jgi:hypothetical protein
VSPGSSSISRLAGAVQHGASTLPDEAFDRFPATGTAEVHLATGFQNIVYDSKHFPDDLRVRIYDYLKREAASEMKAGDTEEQFFYKTRKKGWGPFKKELWELPETVRIALGRHSPQALGRSCVSRVFFSFASKLTRLVRRGNFV